MNRHDLHHMAEDRHPYETMMLDDMFHSTDMPEREYLAHLTLLAMEEDE